MRIAIIQTAFIGDVVLTTPLIHALKQQFKDIEIHFVGVKSGCEVVEGISNLKVHVLDKKNRFKGVGQVIASLESEVPGGFDVLMCVHRSTRSILLARMIKAQRKLAFRSALSVMLGFETVNYPDYSDNIHYADKPMVLFKKLVGKKNVSTPRPFLQTDPAITEQMMMQYGLRNGYLVVSPFSVWGTKNWPIERYAETLIGLNKKTGKRIVITGGQSEKEKNLSQSLSETLKQNSIDHVNLTSRTTLKELVSIISAADLVLSNDSSSVHIAAAFDRPTVAIFGPTVKKWGFFPLSSRSEVAEVDGLDCRPCSLHGPRVCPKKHFKCMLETKPSDVLTLIDRVIKP